MGDRDKDRGKRSSEAEDDSKEIKEAKEISAAKDKDKDKDKGPRSLELAKYKKSKRSTVWFWSPQCKYDVILDTVKNIGWKSVEDDKHETKANIFWVDVALIHERFQNVQPWQLVNHCPGMPNIARKNRMGQNLNRMLKVFPKEYSFYPRTWVLPGEMGEFKQNFDDKGNSLGNKIFIIKPDTGCQGRGIFLTKQLSDVPFGENVVAQVYVKKPLLLDNFKFDLRIYCLVSSIKPLRIYLFQDGLVRMCTEEYVKPNTKNLSMSCMHLTNYAVNKHNSNFIQPSAGSSDDAGQEGSSKRSVKWFMDFIRSEHGDTKADWLWKRIGILCVRTILSIMPTLSKEYDTNFKNFSGVPTDINEILNYLHPVEKSKGDGGGGGKDGSETRSTSPKNEEGGDEDKTFGGDKDNKDYKEKAKKEIKLDPNYPKIRGSRCFEILGFDIMIDSDLKPILIEVNHLPSFGTDSPLDLDIKERLMQQTFPTLACLPDDEIVYQLHLKCEQERKIREKAKEAKEAKDRLDREKQHSISSRPMVPMFNNRVKPLSTKRAPTPPPLKVKIQEPFDNGEPCKPERYLQIVQVLSDIYSVHSIDKVSKIGRLLEKYKNREEEFLKFVYQKYNLTPPWAVEEPPVETKATNTSTTTIETATGGDEKEGNNKGMLENGGVGDSSSSSNKAENSDGGDGSGGGGGDGDNTNEYVGETHGGASTYGTTASEGVESSNSSSNSSNQSNKQGGSESRAENRGSIANLPKRNSRSVSPPSLKKRPQAAWKTMSDDEERAFRKEVFAAHIPDPNDEWMRFEQSYLTQFNRIFPIYKDEEDRGGDGGISPRGTRIDEKSTAGGAGGGGTVTAVAGAKENENEDEEDEGEDDEDEDEENKNSKVTKSTPKTVEKVEKPKYKPASYDEILFQTFVQDRKQRMRMQAPLPRMSDEKDKQLDSQSLSSIEVKGGSKWHTPKTGDLRKSEPKVPTQSQLDAANRLSQGLSVAQTSSKAPFSRRRTDGSGEGGGGTNIVYDEGNGHLDAVTQLMYQQMMQRAAIGGGIPSEQATASSSSSSSMASNQGNIPGDMQHMQQILQQNMHQIPMDVYQQLTQFSIASSQSKGNSSNYNNNSNINNSSNSSSNGPFTAITGSAKHVGQLQQQYQQQQRNTMGPAAGPVVKPQTFSFDSQGTMVDMTMRSDPWASNGRQSLPAGSSGSTIHQSSIGITASVTGSGGILHNSNMNNNLSQQQQQQQRKPGAVVVGGGGGNVGKNAHVPSRIVEEQNSSQDVLLKQLFPNWF